MKFWIAVAVLAAVIIGVSIYAYMLHGDLIAEQEAHARTRSQLDAMQVHVAEATVNIFRTSQAVQQGTLFNPALIEVVPIPESLLHERFVRAPQNLQGAIWRIPVSARGIRRECKRQFSEQAGERRKRLCRVLLSEQQRRFNKESRQAIRQV